MIAMTILELETLMNAQIAKKVLAMFAKVVSPQADYVLTERQQ